MSGNHYMCNGEATSKYYDAKESHYNFVVAKKAQERGGYFMTH